MTPILTLLQTRFEQNPIRHQDIAWENVLAKLNSHKHKLTALEHMENTGGEPDVIGYNSKTNEYVFCDCSAETPKGRTNTCYDRAGQEAREKQGIHPKGNAVDMASAMGIELLTEEQYNDLQKLGNFDAKTSSWLATPPDIRKLGGAIFGDFRFGKVFTYHNTAQSFYSSRGFRGLLRV